MVRQLLISLLLLALPAQAEEEFVEVLFNGQLVVVYNFETQNLRLTNTTNNSYFTCVVWHHNQAFNNYPHKPKVTNGQDFFELPDNRRDVLHMSPARVATKRFKHGFIYDCVESSKGAQTYGNPIYGGTPSL
jgi:hypothetical protein